MLFYVSSLLFYLQSFRCTFNNIFIETLMIQFIQDSENDHIYHSELFSLTKKMAKGEPQKISFTVPIFEPHPPQYYIRAVSDSWLQSEALYTISFQNLALPEVYPFFNKFEYIQIFWFLLGIFLLPVLLLIQYFIQAHTTHTELLDLKPLPVTALGNKDYEALYKFSHFNPIQTQVYIL